MYLLGVDLTRLIQTTPFQIYTHLLSLPSVRIDQLMIILSSNYMGLLDQSKILGSDPTLFYRFLRLPNRHSLVVP